jgi:hypothetical protein
VRNLLLKVINREPAVLTYHHRKLQILVNHHRELAVLANLWRKETQK